jgi:GntR family transcriptional regulator, transcriptional repressor for pyruvate dehydrogenase complex
MLVEAREPAYVRVADALLAQILSGGVAAGQRLASEAELQERFNVSRSTVREALRVLSAYGVVTTTRGVKGGTMVKRFDATKVTSMLAISLDLLYQHEGCTAAEFIGVREQLEVPAARLAAERRTEEQLEALRRTLPSHPPAPPDHDMSESFHKLIVEASGNRLLRVMTEPVFTLMQRRFPRRLAATQFWPVVDDDHGRILDAIEQRDPDRAEQEMRLHLATLHKAYTEIQAGEEPASGAAL